MIEEDVKADPPGGNQWKERGNHMSRYGTVLLVK